MELEWLPTAYDAANEGNFQPLAARMAPDYRHRIPSLGIDWVGPQESLDGLAQTYEASNLNQRPLDVQRHGDFIIASIVGRSDLSSDPFEAVHIFRVDGEKLVEFWGHYRPT